MRVMVALCLSMTLFHAQDKVRFRTDADGPVRGDEKRRDPKDKQPSYKP